MNLSTLRTAPVMFALCLTVFSTACTRRSDGLGNDADETTSSMMTGATVEEGADSLTEGADSLTEGAASSTDDAATGDTSDGTEDGAGDNDADDGTGGSDGGERDPYQDPDPDEVCPEGEVIVNIMELEGRYCAAPCESDSDCPLAPAGTSAVAECALVVDGVSLCALVCVLDGPGDRCPDEMTCENPGDISPPGLGFCTWV